MKLAAVKPLVLGMIGAGCFLVLGGSRPLRSAAHLPSAEVSPSSITVNYPLDGSIFPPEITSPTFLWHDTNDAAKRWVIEFRFAGDASPLRLNAPGEPPKVGDLDPLAGDGSDVKKMVAEQASTHTWKPDDATWATIKQDSQKGPATVTILGYPEDASASSVSSATFSMSTSTDPVGAPIFYRDVPLMTSPPTDKGAIQPLPTFALPLIKWRIRNIAEPQSHIVMEKLYTCGNCHSFSLDGKTFGMDLDGPQNDKGLYAIVPVSKDMTIHNSNVIHWRALQDNPGAKSAAPSVSRFGFMSQVSPDGRYVVTSIAPPGLQNSNQRENQNFAPGLTARLFSVNYMDIRFTQVFYPTRGILAYYDREEKKLHHLAGADDPEYVQTSAFWSPDGKYLIYSRAKAREPYPPGAPKPTYANDPNETQIQYDLYRIPFNNGKGGTPEPLLGASHNGMSNNFPKVSPDGKWIVFVQCKNGLLMRPDSKLYIVPAQGGKARPLNSNTALMNSWHSFSPNGKWLVFSSKVRSPYTRLMLTHIDADGNDSPPIFIDNPTADNRAVNIPEFVNIAPDGLAKIVPEAAEFYRVANQAHDLMELNKVSEAIPVWRQAIELDPSDAWAHYSLAVAYSRSGQEGEALAELRKACEIDPYHSTWFAHLAVSQVNTGDTAGALASYRKALALDPKNAWAEADLGALLFQMGQKQQGLQHVQKAVEIAPDFPDGHNRLGTILAQLGRYNEGVTQLKKAIELDPKSVEYQYNLGYVLQLKGDTPGAIVAFQKAVELSQGQEPHSLAALADAYQKQGRSAEAIQSAQQALTLATQMHDTELEASVRSALRRYEQSDTKTRRP